MAKKQWKGSTLLAPVPAVLVSCADGETKNLITIAWTGIVNSDPPMTYVSVRRERFSYDLIKQSGEFVINLVTEDMVWATDYCGIKTGRTVDKAKETGLHYVPSQGVGCPSVAESPLSLECKVKQCIPLGSHDMFLAEIVNVAVEESLLTTDGRLALERAKLVAYAHGDYFTLGKRTGKFGYSVKKPEKRRRRKEAAKVLNGGSAEPSRKKPEGKKHPAPKKRTKRPEAEK